MEKGLLLKEDVGLLSMETVQTASHQHDYHISDRGECPTVIAAAAAKMSSTSPPDDLR